MTGKTIIDYLKNVIRNDTPQSSARFVAVCFTIAACACGVATIFFAFHHPEKWQAIGALGGTTVTALTGGVGIALKVRRDAGPEEDK